MNTKKRILIAPLNWGLGHATRCIPIIHALLKNNFEVIIASDGVALMLLKKEFPKLEAIELPTYNIEYAKNAKLFKWKLLKDSPKVLKAIKAEKKAIKTIIETHFIDGVISDNRLGLHSKKVPCVFISHQLQVLSGNTTWLSTKMHQKIMKQFDVCWVPDNLGEPNLSGKLGHIDMTELPTRYLGPLSRFHKKETKITTDLLVLLSGPEPQRTLLENKLIEELKAFKGKIVFVKGVMEETQTKVQEGNMTIYNFMTSTLLEQTINESALVVSRSGYTTIMDLAKLEKKAFFIPTPGQFEQEYLAKRLDSLGIVPCCKQEDFTINKLEAVTLSTGLKQFDYEVNYKKLFSLF
ncbi:glycosyltransferase [Lacinutrix sp. C3R15]|uniref:glycosyltransferase n=1 Tax=Flavobacteriaceae TaxID=49546 RepID=UPI001C092F7E|nr:MULTISPECIES: glycosyltransferase [Flavobacteriaceae]MBU2939058.1 glycosyltransferase [Lacinutrix sp. C3R15]MDO6622373.1 glycosyltransferase family protein [Oceanihabitans sp. 1_MG-2023]